MKNISKKCVLLMSSRSIMRQDDGLQFPEGIYESGPLVVVSGRRDELPVPDSDIRNLLQGKKVEEAFIYLAGFSLSIDTFKREMGMEATMIFLGVALACVDKENIHFVGCSCNEKMKRDFARARGVGFILSDCGGSFTLGEFAAKVMKKVAV